MEAQKRPGRFNRRRPNETTIPKEQRFEIPPTVWVDPWTRVVWAPHNAELPMGSVVRSVPERGIVAAVLLHPAGWYWIAGDAEGMSHDADVAKVQCDMELLRHGLTLRHAPEGCDFEDADQQAEEDE